MQKPRNKEEVAEQIGRLCDHIARQMPISDQEAILGLLCELSKLEAVRRMGKQAEKSQGEINVISKWCSDWKTGVGRIIADSYLAITDVEEQEDDHANNISF